MPLAINHQDEKKNFNKGLWDSLMTVLGTGFSDFINKESCWSVFHTSGSPFGLDHRALITRAHDRYSNAATAACQDLNSKNLLTSPIDGFAFDLRKVHKKAQDLIRQLDYMCLPAKVLK